MRGRFEVASKASLLGVEVEIGGVCGGEEEKGDEVNVMEEKKEEVVLWYRWKGGKLRGGIPLGTESEQNGRIFGVEGLDSLENVISILGVCGREDGVDCIRNRLIGL